MEKGLGRGIYKEGYNNSQKAERELFMRSLFSTIVLAILFSEFVLTIGRAIF